MGDFLPWAYKKGEWIRFEDATVSVATNALQYGTGIFGGIRVIPGAENQALLFRIDRHVARLAVSSSYLGYKADTEHLLAVILEFVRRNKIRTSCYLRPFIGNTGLGITPRLHGEEQDFILYGLELGDYLAADGVACRFSSWVRQEDRSLPLRGKVAGAYITSALAKTEAQSSGFDEAILLNSQGKVSEASGMNVFIVRDGTLITPGVDQDILEGITRKSVIEIAEHLGLKVVERGVDKTELLIADEMFLTGSAARITPVKRLENRTFPADRPITQSLLELFTRITLGQEPKFAHWVTAVEV